MKTAVGLVDGVLLSSFHAQGRPIEPVFAKDAFTAVGQVVQVHAYEAEAPRGRNFRIGSFLFPCLSQLLQVIESIFFFRPEIDRGGGAHEVHGEPRRIAFPPWEGADERHPEYLPRQLVALKIDQVEVTGHPS